ncbi:MAG: hypothetical protein IT580_09295 [Verrucomicrobiales bacterium]|nr:hypothetical protein [Verrucomicrobiales bacterium]
MTVTLPDGRKFDVADHNGYLDVRPASPDEAQARANRLLAEGVGPGEIAAMLARQSREDAEAVLRHVQSTWFTVTEEARRRAVSHQAVSKAVKAGHYDAITIGRQVYVRLNPRERRSR